MAAVGSVQGEKCVEESDESADCVWSPLTDSCRRNGFSNNCHCKESSRASDKTELTKYNCIVKINGLKTLTKTAISGSLRLRPRAYQSQRIASHYLKRDAGCQLRLASLKPDNRLRTSRYGISGIRNDFWPKSLTAKPEKFKPYRNKDSFCV